MSPSEHDVFLAFPGTFIRQMPSTRLQIRITSVGPEHAVLGEYVLDHAGVDPHSR